MLAALAWTLVAGSGCKLRTAEAELQATTKPSSASMAESYHSYGIKPDCSEAPFDYRKLYEYGRTSVNQQEFLEKIPEGALQTFTLVYDSNSAQSAGISPEYPGVIRMSIDGKLVMRYTCDTRSKVYNTVEVMRFDDLTKKFVFHDFDFREMPESESCSGCHSEPGPGHSRPNWAMYDVWPGVYGSRDDYFPPESADELNNFKAFLKNRKNDPCYQTLPWPKAPEGQALPAEYDYYPYSRVKRNSNYVLRPNLKFTEILSHLQAQAIFRRVQQSPNYKKVWPLLAVEAAYCRYPRLQRRLEDTVPGLRYPGPSEIDVPVLATEGLRATTHEPRHPDSRAVGLYSYGATAGLLPYDWTLLYAGGERSGYLSGIPEGEHTLVSINGNPFDLPISALVQAEIIKDVTQNVEELRPHAAAFTMSRGATVDFGSQFACIDELGAGLVFNDAAKHKALCDALIAKADPWLRDGVYQPRDDQMTLNLLVDIEKETIKSIIIKGTSMRYICVADRCTYVTQDGDKRVIKFVPGSSTSFLYDQGGGREILMSWVRD